MGKDDCTQALGTANQRPNCADLFCGSGAFSLAASGLGIGVAYAYEPDGEARRAYLSNFGQEPHSYIGEGFTADNTPPDGLDLLFCRFPDNEAEFDQVALRFLRYSSPIGACFISPPRKRKVNYEGEAKIEREKEDGKIAEYMARRMTFLGYEVSSGVLMALSDEDGMVPHRVLVGIQPPGMVGRDFPWPLIMEKTQVSRERVPVYWQSVKKAGGRDIHGNRRRLGGGAGGAWSRVRGDERLTRTGRGPGFPASRETMRGRFSKPQIRRGERPRPL